MDIERGRKLREVAARQVHVINNAISPQAVIARGGPIAPDKMLHAVLDSLGVVLACQAWIIGELIEASGEIPPRGGDDIGGQTTQ